MSHAQNPVILTYHSISEGATPLETPPQVFAEQMEWLASNARVAPLGEIAASVAEKKPIAERTVTLTFDDAFQDFYTHAAPVLARLGFPATVFVPTAYCGRTNAWPGQPSWVVKRPLMDWEQVREVAEQGFALGAHSHTHADLTALSAEEAGRDIAACRREIEERTGQRAEFFCYPYGKWNASVREQVKQSFRAACSTAAGAVEPEADPFALPRVDAHYLREGGWFGRMFTRSFAIYIAGRRLIRRLRGAPEGNYARV